MPKEDCKYWDKCYQKNDYHLQKYNHPQKEKNTDTEDTNETTETEENPELAQSPKNSKDKADIATGTSTSAIKNMTEERRKKFDTSQLKEEALSNIAGKNYMEILQKRINFSVQAEYDELLKSNEFIRYKFLVEMPEDFYKFWQYITEQSKENSKPIEIFEKHFQLQLVGPFEFLAGKFHGANICEPGDYLRHWRFYYDPPEFQTIFVKKGTGIHYGYWRDRPKDKENLLIARNDSAKGCELEFVASNAFDALLYYLEKDFTSTPFNTAFVGNVKKSVPKFIETNGLKLEKFAAIKKRRDAQVVTKTFHRAGIVVPIEEKTDIGYRPLLVSDAELKKILGLFDTSTGDDDKENKTVTSVVIEKLQPIITAASIAVDECDFGTSLELGIDLFCTGRQELRMVVQSLLVPAYTLLERPQFIAIFKAHTEKRSKSLNLSIFDCVDKK